MVQPETRCEPKASVLVTSESFNYCSTISATDFYDLWKSVISAT